MVTNAPRRRPALVPVAVVGFALIVLPVTLANAAGNDDDAAASASVKKKVKKLTKQVKALNAEIEALQGEQGSGRPPSGSAGGDLSGTYPDPSVRSNAVGSAEVSPDSLTGADIAEGTLGEVPSAGTATPAGPASGDLSGSYPGPSIAPNAVGPGEIANPQRTVSLPPTSFLNCTDSEPIDFVEGGDNDPDFAQVPGGRVYLAWDTNDTDVACTSVVLPADAGGALAPLVKVLSVVGATNNNDWSLVTVQQRTGAAESDTTSSGVRTDCDLGLTDGTAYVCGFVPTLTQPGNAQPGDVFTIRFARAGGSNEMRAYGVTLEYSALQ